MKILLFGSSGGIGSAIKEKLQKHEFVENRHNIDWLIFAQGVIEEENYKKTFGVNVFRCISQTQKALPHLKQGVIYISSTAALTANSRFPIYSASKAALNTYALAMQKAYPQLEFYALCPGPTDTRMWRSLGLEGPPQSPEAVANAVEHIIQGEYLPGIIQVKDSIITPL